MAVLIEQPSSTQQEFASEAVNPPLHFFFVRLVARCFVSAFLARTFARCFNLRYSARHLSPPEPSFSKQSMCQRPQSRIASRHPALCR
jgi:hypothetical protein